MVKNDSKHSIIKHIVKFACTEFENTEAVFEQHRTFANLVQTGLSKISLPKNPMNFVVILSVYLYLLHLRQSNITLTQDQSYWTNVEHLGLA